MQHTILPCCSCDASVLPLFVAQVVNYLLEQLRAYQQQLQELALHNAWKEHAATTGNPTTPSLTLPPIAAAANSKVSQSRSSHQEGHPAFAAPAQHQPPPLGAWGESSAGGMMAVGAQLKPWGQRSKDRGGPTRFHGPDAYLRANR